MEKILALGYIECAEADAEIVVKADPTPYHAAFVYGKDALGQLLVEQRDGIGQNPVRKPLSEIVPTSPDAKFVFYKKG